MKTKTIYIIRHGETEYNRLGYVQGSGIDSDLNEKGQWQANAFYTHYSHIKFEKIYTSALKRTLQSVDCFIQKEIPFESLVDFNEISWGEAEGVMPDFHSNSIFSTMIKEWREGNIDFQAGIEGETPREVQARLKKALEYVLAQKNEQVVLLAIHGRVLRILLCMLLNIPLSKMDTFAHSNLCVYGLRYEYDTQKFELFLENDTTHLR